MYILVLISLIFLIIMTYIVFKEVEKSLDNQKEIENTLINSEKSIWRLERDFSKIRKVIK